MTSFDPNRTDRKLIPSLGPACTLIRDAMRDLGIHEAKSTVNLKKATDSIQGVSDTVSHLVRLLARSRAVELDVVTKQFAPFISTDLLKKMQQDFRDLEASTSDANHGSDNDAEAAWDAELERRAGEIKSGRESGESTDQVFSELRAKHS